jgi:23S rRNA pseudouridine1911/1915/1917 synthase
MVIDPAKPFDLQHRVDPAYDGERLDRFVQAMVPTISRTRVQRYNRAGRVLVNGRRRADNWRVRSGDRVVLKVHEPPEGADAARHIPVSVLYEDEWLLAVNKQPGLVVHPVALHRHNTLMNALYWRYKDRLPAAKELSLVNRIDKLTSGVVLVSKDIRAKRNLQEQFEARRVYKTYQALVAGGVEEESGEINLPLGPKADCQNRCVQAVRRDSAGKPSLSRYWVLERLRHAPPPAAGPPPAGTEPLAAGRAFTLLRLSPQTGRQHQLRVHAAAAGHPLVGDHLYGDNRAWVWRAAGGEAAGADASGTGRLERFALHAESLTITHPVEKREMRFTAPLPADLAGALEALRRGWPVGTVPAAADPGVRDGPAEEHSAEHSTRYSSVPMGEHPYDRL